ncbi:MAG: SdpI family protein [Deltaproteobacteria bacterium]|nr:SdpI family protein [Deltaproteobacteria bacterium]MBK8715849.1 SdpI family protein [Deltaproteobacteria bacterium]MBP7286579.1 SdpI family protein [Nannocystaceae bacterium]
MSRSSLFPALIIVGIMALASLWGAAVLPDDVRIPIHFDLQLRADRWVGKTAGLLLAPGVALAVVGVMMLAPRIDPRGANLRRSQHAVDVSSLAITSLFAMLHLSVLGHVAGLSSSPAQVLPLVLSVFLVAVGNVMGKLASNHVIGVRTRWTLADEQVWRSTQRFTGRAFVAVGLVGLATTFLTDARRGGVVVTAGMLIAAAAGVLASYLSWRRRHVTPARK